ncbi:DUF262 domain-containing protein [Candidatus Saccharibacteria bacterium]|nr:DUF262 domain-containing protein [Candidatus Saccharibacteria bacterium]
MKIQLQQIPIREVVSGYVDNDEEGVLGYGGKLNIRPKYQREFVYKDAQRDAVIDTIRRGFPLNVMYWVKNEDGTYEVLDGQQRTISIARYFDNIFSINEDGNRRKFFNLTDTEKEQILNYNLMVYFCEGNDKEKLDWFKTINIAGERLFVQELRNAVYTGTWLTDAKRHFSKNGCAAYGLAKDYVAGAVNRQDYLQTAIDWLSGGHIEDYMSDHQGDQNANELWLYFQNVISWVKLTFPKYRSEMKGINWGKLYNEFKDAKLDTDELETRIVELMQDDDVTKRAGIYEYVLNGNERALSLRAFDDKIKRAAYERQKGVCSACGKQFAIEEMEADHITPWSRGGKTVADNCQMLCRDDNRRKSGI